GRQPRAPRRATRSEHSQLDLAARRRRAGRGATRWGNSSSSTSGTRSRKDMETEMKFIKSKKGVAALIAAVAAVSVGAFGAYAWFSTSGDGTGSALVGTSSPFVVTTSPAIPVLGPLAPAAVGDANAPLAVVDYQVANSQEGNQFLHTVTIKVDPSFDIPGTDGNPHCTAADFSLNFSLTPGNTVTDTYNHNLLSESDAPANAVSGQVVIQMVESDANQDACKGATVPLLLHAS